MNYMKHALCWLETPHVLSHESALLLQPSAEAGTKAKGWISVFQYGSNSFTLSSTVSPGEGDVSPHEAASNEDKYLSRLSPSWLDSIYPTVAFYPQPHRRNNSLFNKMTETLADEQSSASQTATPTSPVEVELNSSLKVSNSPLKRHCLLPSR